MRYECEPQPSKPHVTVTVNEKMERESGTLESILRKVAPALIGPASSAVLERVAGSPQAD